jgi:hypothetical protein
VKPTPPTIFIGATDVMPALLERVPVEGNTLNFSDGEPLEALKAITAHRPPLVVLERRFAATPRGAALINRIRSDASLTHMEVRVVSHTGDYVRVVSQPAPGQASVASPPGPAVVVVEPVVAHVPEKDRLDWHGTRRVPRVRFRDGVDIQLDGNAARVIDMSVMGAQALCPRALRPSQKIRITVVDDSETVRFRASVAWARFELARSPAPPHYRVGVEFIDADPAWIESFCDKNRG